ncbi:MAG TPA: hypothetical protein VLY24_28025 [Bryobacteraceae bacterium]|nr:hypothetical protein [Bryobacteraceae bacterium]
MPGLFENTVSAICYEVAMSQDTSTVPYDEPPYNDVVAFVLEQWHRMPRFLAWPLRIATLGFATRGLVSGHFFHRLRPERRRLQLESWRTSSIGPCRDLIRFYRSLAILALYSRVDTAR